MTALTQKQKKYPDILGFKPSTLKPDETYIVANNFSIDDLLDKVANSLKKGNQKLTILKEIKKDIDLGTAFQKVEPDDDVFLAKIEEFADAYGQRIIMADGELIFLTGNEALRDRLERKFSGTAEFYCRDDEGIKEVHAGEIANIEERMEETNLPAVRENYTDLFSEQGIDSQILPN